MASDLQLLGPVHVVSLNYTQYSSRYDRFLAGDISPAFNPRLGGGALLDLNVYNIHLAVSLFGAPLDVHYFPNLQKGVDTSGVLVLAYDDKQASLTAAIGLPGLCPQPACHRRPGSSQGLHALRKKQKKQNRKIKN
ncbi:hypothetical protein [Lactobacillus delbrueckii]|uniref:GFO/IDH/MocA-like oxidoreductase domain-containing protein n=1 Tax=Lactobacillus delbrueckii subsp. bulgaricus TaxID=1585 RepID=A0AAV5PDL9_LACDE|nr:hypothetical protein [Lactobacillus delbrueckii]ADY84367.1 Hypothetical conserved protein [Lactobacillus delbrueckii subsp. bulgaricus 2038]MCD5458187.1 hypothetical protein [Lactobacillus delbrueckii subsp. bulgaricus]MCD9226099.1 hypothetical protein [Lactobacillus delbrueckii subsp. bulgaricus]OAL41399.1 putative dehydrogenase related protein [Lactobacillus delbrueckii subsp. bulgaricus]GMB84432.1 hypothetical protein ME0899_06570 [Lactobacillus delbrueckii subsp. bulgaricus]